MSELKQIVDDVWKKFDTNNNGSLDTKEAKAFLAEICKGSDGLSGRSAELMALLDKNNDGKITK